jgi:hypothetical protein
LWYDVVWSLEARTLFFLLLGRTELVLERLLNDDAKHSDRLDSPPQAL